MATNADEALKTIDRLYRQLIARQSLVTLTDNYYTGKQRLRFASDEWAEVHRSRYTDFADNWCAPVVNSLAERLDVTGFRLGDTTGKPSDDEKLLWSDWVRNDMEMQSSMGLVHTMTSSRSHVLVWADPKSQEPISTWERSDEVIVDYDPEFLRKRRAALKTWFDDSTEYANLYLPEVVYKFKRERGLYENLLDKRPHKGAGSEFFEESGSIRKGSEGSWQFVTEIPNPLGVVPIVELDNRPLLGAAPLSDIEGTIAMQDAVNLLWAYLFSAADFASMPARVVMGQEAPKIPRLGANGKVVGYEPLPLEQFEKQRIAWLSGENAKIGQWSAAELDPFLNVIQTAIAHIAAQTRTPPHYLILGKGMVNVNADGMKAAETGLVKRAEEFQRFTSPAISEVFALYALVRNNKELAKSCRVGKPLWKDAENRSEAQLVDALLKLHQIGFPFEWIAERYGVTQTEMVRLLEMRENDLAIDPTMRAVHDALNGVATDDGTSDSPE